MKHGAPPVLINISLTTILQFVAVLVSLALIYILRDLVLAILVSVVVASAVEPAALWLVKHRLPRVPAVLVIYFLALGLLFVLIPVFLFPVISELSSLVTALPERVIDFSGWLGQSFSLAEVLTALQARLADASRGFVQTASFVFGGFLSFVLIIVFSFYLAVQPDGIENFLRVVTPLDRENYVLNLWRRAQRKIGLWMQGQVLLGLLIGVLVFLGLTILQVPHVLVLAIVAALFELIPFFGPVLAAVPAVLLGFSLGPTQGLMVLAFYVIIQQFENHLIYPLVVRKMVGVPAMLVIISLIAGTTLAGFLGLILAVPVSVVLIELLSDWEQKKLAAARRLERSSSNV